MKLKALLLTSLLFTAALPAFASVQIMGTRVIFNAKDKEQAIRVNNVGNAPSLVQVWLDSRPESGVADKEDLPFVITPPMARVNVGKGKTFRIFQTQDTVNKYPKDRESVLWVNFLDIPPEDASLQDKNLLNLAFRTRLKFFYRPAGLKGDEIQAGENLKWSMVSNAEGYTYTCDNNSPFHVSFSRLVIKGDEKTLINGDMVAPFSKKTFSFKTKNKTAKPVLEYTFITDLGAYVDKQF
ncbi:molecular chaperone [Chimaeribacter californicus]|uniref:Molecular chaperone n=1 Tax=Chimaeribacter californicus TaxID=2060067 RepID=A0A2N5E571_9GAMM|nr:molecular chaperone [Chimaeribacter californicus]PLR36281.1 molecular chaperone [Chimaeribacter californicus]